MIIAYSPEGEEPKSWDLGQIKLMATEAEQIERLTDWTWTEASERLTKGSMIALRAIVFILAKREEPTLRYQQFNPPAEALDYWLDADEREAMRAAVRDADIAEEQREQLLKNLDELGEEMVKRGYETAPGLDPETLPKDSAPEASPTAA